MNSFKFNSLQLWVLLCFPFVLSFCSPKKRTSLKPQGYETENILTIENGNIKAVFVDNTEIPPAHRGGYNGIAQLFHAQEDSAIFVPAYAGFNLEHVFGGDSLEQLFEPRLHPMTLYRKTDHEVLLHQQATPLSSVESLTSFKVVAPHYIDVVFECIFHNPEFFRHGYAGLFWASYIQDPDDKKIYFKGRRETDHPDSTSWIAAWSTEHGSHSTHRSIHDDQEFFFADNFNASLASNFSGFRYSQPFFFGRFNGMVLAYLFDSKEVIRFSQSPTGGGKGNPAWDFQYLVPSPAAGKRYSFKVRMIYKPFISENDIEEEFQKWKPKK
jgi:hypothetical protein